MQKIIGLLLLFAILVLSSDAQTRRGRAVSRPTSKNKAATPKPVPGKLIEAPAIGLIVEKYVSSYDIKPDGTARHIWELQQKCNSEICLARVKNVKHVFNGDLQNVKALDAYILKPDGTKIILPVTAAQSRPTAQAEAAPAFSSLREFEIVFDGIQKGDSAYYKLEILTKKSTVGTNFDSIEFFPVIFDWKSIEINISAPDDYPIFVEAVGLEGGKLTGENGGSRWQYRKQNVPVIEIEPAMYDIAGISPRMSLTTYKTFEELGSAFWENFKNKAVVTPEVQELAVEITRDITDPKQQAAAVYDWVNKNIRYLSVVLDRSGWIPHSTAEIIANRYGDCKDYTTIIYALLKAKGIESLPVLIRADMGEWFPSVATAAYFNHAILFIPSLNLFADATSPNTRLGLIAQSLVGKKAVMAGDRTGIIEVPRNNPGENQIISDVILDFAANGSLKARSRNTYVGRSEILFRPLFGDSMFTRNSTTFVQLLMAYFGVEGSGKVISVGNPHKVGEPFAVEMEVDIPNFTKFISEGRLPIPLGVNMINSTALEQFVSTDERRTNLIVGATTISETFLVNLPPDVTAVAGPTGINFENAVGRFKLSFDLKNNQMKVVRELVISKDSISPKDYPLLKELIRQAVEALNVEIGYTADAVTLGTKNKETRSLPTKKRTPPRSSYDIIKNGPAGGPGIQLKPLETRRLEARLITDQNDIETRMQLIHHYSFPRGKVTPAVEKARLLHGLWFVRNRPEIDSSEIYGWGGSRYSRDSKEYAPLRTEWLAQVGANKTNARIRVNAVNFIKSNDPDLAAGLLIDGSKLDPENYEFPLLLTEVKDTVFKDYDAKTPPETKLATALKLLEYGELALKLIKKERSDSRDADRNTLLKRLCVAAYEAGSLEKAANFAKELILDFGQSSSDFHYDQVAHVGNITLGRVELKQGNIEKAKEYLLIAIRAPLRMDYNSLEEIDMKLARDLFEKGEKAAVLEYLGLCLNLGNLKTYPVSYENEIKAIKLWQEQAGKGINPSFDFAAP